MATILCGIFDDSTLVHYEHAIRREGHRAVVASSVADAIDLARDEKLDLIFSCATTLAPNGERLADVLRGMASVSVLEIGEGGDLGPLAPPFEIAAAIRRAIHSSLVGRSPTISSDDPDTEPVVIGDSIAIRRVLETVEQVAPTRSVILLQGESGTGKEVLARLIHHLSTRRGCPFVAVNCAAMPQGLVESTLFGHEKGAFTGASSQVKGAFERAHRGTLLLDEISEMDLGLQAKLLRAIQEMEFERLGGSKPIRVDVRIIATTNRDLAEEVDAGRFREDLYYRISVIPLLIPPLRERREDIPALADYFMRKAAREMNKPIGGISPRALELLMGHDWPGNVRELAHVVERAVALCRGNRLEPDDFIPEKRGIAPWRRPKNRRDPRPVIAELYSYNIHEAESVLIEKALEATGGNRTEAARLLGISVRTLRNKLKRPAWSREPVIQR